MCYVSIADVMLIMFGLITCLQEHITQRKQRGRGGGGRSTYTLSRKSKFSLAACVTKDENGGGQIVTVWCGTLLRL